MFTDMIYEEANRFVSQFNHSVLLLKVGVIIGFGNDIGGFGLSLLKRLMKMFLYRVTHL